MRTVSCQSELICGHTYYFIKKAQGRPTHSFFYKIINNLAQVPHEHILTKAYEGTRKTNNHKFRHIVVNTSQYMQSFFPKTVGPWNQLSFADSPTLENFQTNLLSINQPYHYAPLGALLSINQNQNQNQNMIHHHVMK